MQQQGSQPHWQRVNHSMCKTMSIWWIIVNHVPNTTFNEAALQRARAPTTHRNKLHRQQGLP